MVLINYKREVQKIMKKIGAKEGLRLFLYEKSVCSPSFLGFLENYVPLSIPKDFTILDVGCGQAFQAAIYNRHRKYIGIDPAVPVEARLVQGNASYYRETLQEFLKNTYPSLSSSIEEKKLFVICSEVPDEEARDLIEKTFPYYQIVFSPFVNKKSLPYGFRYFLSKFQKKRLKSSPPLYDVRTKKLSHTCSL